MQRRGVRSVTPGVLSPEECVELTFVHRSLSAAGYSPHLWTSKLSDIAYSEPALLLPLVAARDKVAAAAERALGHPYELCIEFTGLVSWTTGASINWHHDSNRPYLEQRHATAVAYLNGPGEEFGGGVLEFRDGDPQSVSPESGSMVAFLADESNTHRVSEVTHGERLTLTLWFTLLPEHSEDAKVLRLLQQSEGFYGRERPHSMFQDSGSDVRVQRLQAAGVAATGLQPAAPPSGLLTLLSAEGGQPCASCASGGKAGAVSFETLDEALLAVAFAQWRARSMRLPACTCRLGELLNAQAPQLAAYMQGLRSLLPAATAEWCAAGVLYDMRASA
jgi:hypothetical protein